MEQTQARVADGVFVCVCVCYLSVMSPPTSPRTTVVMGTWLSEGKTYFHHEVFVLFNINQTDPHKFVCVSL